MKKFFSDNLWIIAIVLVGVVGAIGYNNYKSSGSFFKAVK